MNKAGSKKIKAIQLGINILVGMVLYCWMTMVTVADAGGRIPPLAMFFSMFPFMIFGGLYGYLISFIAFLSLFITRLALDLDGAYVMSVYLLAMYGCAMMGQYRWYRLRRKAICGTCIIWLVEALLGLVCSDVIAVHQLGSIPGSSLVFSFSNALVNIFGSGLILYLFFNRAPEFVKGSFPLGVGYTQEYLKNLLLQNELRKTRVSARITAIIVGVILCLGLFSSTFSQLLISEMSATRQMRMEATQPAVGSLPEGTQPAEDAPLQGVADPQPLAGNMAETAADDADDSSMNFDPEEMRSFMRSNYGNVFAIKILLMNLCLGLPLAGIANFYVKMRIGAPIGRLSSYMVNFMDTTDETRAAYAGSIKEIHSNTHDEISDLYHATEIMAYEVTGYIEQLKEEQRLQEDLKVARAASEAKSSFLSNMSHEIRTPINAVLGMDEMILRECEDKEIRRYAADIKNAGNTLLSLVNDILDFSKIEAGKMDILPVQYQIGSMINDLVNMLSGKADDKGLKLVLHIDESLPTLLFGDEVRIKQCVTNILTNAVKYTEKGSVTLSVSYEKSGEDEIALKFQVVDTGIGIKQEDMEKLYSPFERIEEIRNRTIEGTGLGMSIVKKLLAMMDSRLAVKSVYGEGSDFSFVLKQKVMDWTPMGDFVQAYKDAVDSMERYQESFTAPDAKVLIVDDTRMNLTVIRSLLKATKLKVVTAESGAETLKLVCQEKYDCIFLDHRMPEMDGVETYRAMQTLENNLNSDTPCIALTANAVAGARDEYLAIGFKDYLSKPVDSRKLEKMLMNYLPKEKLHVRESAAEDVAGAGDTLLPELTGVDRAAAMKACGGEDVALQVMREFRLSIPEKADAIERYAAEGDWRNYTVLVHALKSSARLIGAGALSEAAAYLEQCGNDENTEEIEAKTPQLLADYRSYIEKLTPIAADTDDTDKPEISADELAGAYSDMAELIEAYDFDSADMIMEMLSEYRMPGSEKERYEALKLKLNAVDREAVLKILKGEE